MEWKELFVFLFIVAVTIHCSATDKRTGPTGVRKYDRHDSSQGSDEESSGDSEEWSYSGKHGPKYWHNINGGFCGGHSQSPINIAKRNVMVKHFTNWTMEGYSLDDYEGGTASSIINNGHSLTVNLEGNYIVRGGGLLGNYRAIQFHFHWGSENTQGSEHTVNHHRYAAEMHIVHYNDKYQDFSDAVAAGDTAGLAVFGVFIEVGQENKALKDVFEKVSHVPYKGDIVHDIGRTTTISVADILPMNLVKFYRYSGSLTTPTCNEVVVWTLFEEPIQISQQQLNVLRGLHKHRDGSENIVDNYRPVQHKHGRAVYVNSIRNIL